MSHLDAPAPVPAFQHNLFFNANQNDTDYRVRFEAAAAQYRCRCTLSRKSDLEPSEGLRLFGGDRVFTKTHYYDAKRAYGYVGALLGFADAVVSVEVEVPTQDWRIRVATDDEAVIERWIELVQQSLPPP